MNRIKIIITVFIVALFQISLINKIKIFGVKPDLLFLVTVFYGFKGSARLGLFAGFLSGFFEDILGGVVLGINTFGLSICGFLIGKLSDNLYEENRITQLFISIISFLILYIINYIFLQFFIDLPSFLTLLVTFIIPIGIYTTCAGIFLFWLFDKLGLTPQDIDNKKIIMGILH